MRCVLLLLLTICQSSYAYDSLTRALQLHQSSQFSKALPLFIHAAQKFRANSDLANYSLCQLKIADIIRIYGGGNLAVSMLEKNEKAIAHLFRAPSLLMAQNYTAKAEAYFSVLNLTEFKNAVAKSIAIKRQAKLPEAHFAEDYLQLARYYKEVPERNDSCFYWACSALKSTYTDKRMSVYVLPKIYNMLGHYFHPASVSYFRGKRDSLKRHFKISRAYFDSALSLAFQQPIRDELIIGKIYHNLGNSYNNEGKETMGWAMAFYRKSMNIYREFGSPTELALKDWVVGKGYERMQFFDSALGQYQNGIKRVVPNFQPKSNNELPTLQPTLSDLWFSSHLVNKANVYTYRYIADRHLSDLLLAYDHHVHLLKFHRYLVAQSRYERESIHWSFLYGSNAFDYLVWVGYELLQRTGSIHYLQNAYGLIASAKYAFLNKGIMNSSTTRSIEKSQLNEERKLVIKNISRSIPHLSEDNIASVLPLLDTAGEKQPLSKFDLTKQFSDTLVLTTLSDKLHRENAALVDFYLHGYECTVFTISKDKFEVHRLILSPDLFASIKELKKILEMSPTAYARLANKIYRATLDTALMMIPKEIKRVIVSPGGILHEIPWDALVTDTLNNQTFRSLNYVLKKYTIRTVMSPLQITRSVANVHTQFFGVAPNFSNSTRFSSIPFSTALVSSKAKQFDGTFLTTLKGTPIRSSILHLASHISTDAIHPYNSAIHLGDKDSISIADLQNSDIQAEMVVLNGCRTGSGKHIQSEGTISLARAFCLLGAKSVLTTSWNVDDKATAELLSIWYENVERGEELDFALRKAKQKFIESAGSDDSAHPFYWAGLQLTGSAKPIVTSNRTAIIVILAFGLFLMLVVSVWWKRREKN